MKLSSGFVLKQLPGFCNKEIAVSPLLTPFCSCLFQILSQWELSPVVRSALAYCFLCFYLRSPSSCTVNIKAVSACIWHAYTRCFSFIYFISVIWLLRLTAFTYFWLFIYYCNLPCNTHCIFLFNTEM